MPNIATLASSGVILGIFNTKDYLQCSKEQDCQCQQGDKNNHFGKALIY